MTPPIELARNLRQIAKKYGLTEPLSILALWSKAQQAPEVIYAALDAFENLVATLPRDPQPTPRPPL